MNGVTEDAGRGKDDPLHADFGSEVFSPSEEEIGDDCDGRGIMRSEPFKNLRMMEISEILHHIDESPVRFTFLGENRGGEGENLEGGRFVPGY